MNDDEIDENNNNTDNSCARKDPLVEIKQSLQRVEEDLVKKIKSDTIQKEAFEKLYAEMKLYKDNFLQSATKPLVQDIILLYDNIKRKYKSAANETIKHFSLDILEDMEEVLYRRDVELIVCHDKKLNRQLQRAIKVVSTSNLEEDGNIIEVIRDGFLWGENTLRLQEVAIYKYSPEGDKQSE